MCSYKSVFVVTLMVFTSNAKNDTSNVIGFPEKEENPGLINKDNRQPLFAPTLCPANELYYPGDQKDDWICDCRPSFLYHPGTDACWPSHRMGPCGPKQYLVLSQDSAIPVCQTNPCNVDGYVTWNGKCERLGSSHPCKFMEPISATLEVNATTLVVSCVRLTVAKRFGELNTIEYSYECLSGGKRSISGKCTSIMS